MKTLFKGIVAVLIVLVAIGVYAGTASAHTSSATCLATGQTRFVAASYPGGSKYTVDGGPATTFSGGFTLTLSGTVEHTVFIDSSDNWPNVTLKAGPCTQPTTTTAAPTTTICQDCVPNTQGATTTTVQGTTTSTTPPGSSSTLPTTSSDPSTTTPSDASTTVPGSSVPPTSGTPTTACEGICRPADPIPQTTFDPNECIGIDPATGMGTTRGFAQPCGGSSTTGAASTTAFVPTGDLPATGTSTTVAVMAAVLFGLIGVFLVFVARRNPQVEVEGQVKDEG